MSLGRDAYRAVISTFMKLARRYPFRKEYSLNEQVDFALQPVLDFGLAKTVTLLNRGFAGYQVQVEFSLPSLLETARYNGIDFAASRLVLRAGEAVGVALIARRGWTGRLAAMAIIPSARSQGVGTWFMGELIAEAKGRGERRMVLEVIEGNLAAVALYRGRGFCVRRRLLSFRQTEGRGRSRLGRGVGRGRHP